MLAGVRPLGGHPAWAITVVLALALGLRLWGIRHGLPYVYNPDENAHFVPRAIGFFGHSYNPGYFINPPAFSYVLHAIFAVWFGGRQGVSGAFAADPSDVFALARVAVALSGVVSVWLLYVAGRRLLGRNVGLLAAALMAVAFLPVYYSRLALNDVPALVPLTLALVGAVGILRRGWRVDYLVAGAGVGFAVATKYTAGIALLPLLVATVARIREEGDARRSLRRVGAGVIAAATAFLLLNPYALLDLGTFLDDLTVQSTAAGEGGKLGLTEENGVAYYLWTVSWGLGWVPALAALGGAAVLLRSDRRAAALLLPGPILFLLFMGVQERFFGRWLLPAFPLLCILAAHGALLGAAALARLRPRHAAMATSAASAALLGQGLIYSTHNAVVLSRPDTRALTRAWLVEHVPAGTKIVVEPIAPDQWAQDPGRPSPATNNGNRWRKYPTSRRPPTYGPFRRRAPRSSEGVKLEDYERITTPALVSAYERDGWCYVVAGSTQWGRALAEPGEVPAALAYYRELTARSTVAYRASPYDDAQDHVAFNFDWSFDYYPLAYHRPGPEVIVYRLGGGRCAGG